MAAALADAAADLDSAHDRAESSLFTRALSPLPLIGEQIAGLRDLTRAADALGAEAELSGQRISQAIDAAGTDPSARVDLFDVLLAETSRIEAVVVDIDLGPDRRLMPLIRSARAKVRDALSTAPDRLDPLQQDLRALRTLFAGPTSYLVLVGNNAEMRAGAGMPLSAGLATIVDGDVQLGDFKAVVDEVVTYAPTGPFNSNPPPEYATTYPTFDIGMSIPETAVVPDFRVTGPMYADIAADTQGWDVAGTIFIDALMLAELLDVVGPVEVAGVTYTSETAPQLVLNQPYLDFDQFDDRSARLDAQGDLAGALFEAIQERAVDPLDLVAAMQRSATGRHLMMWSEDDVIQDLLTSFGAAGAILPYETLVSFQNTAANKLDWYIQPRIDAEVIPLSQGNWEVTLSATIENPADIETSRYIDGFLAGLDGGTHRMLFTVMVPQFVTDLEILSDPVTESGPDGASEVIATRFSIARGETREVVVRFRLPPAYGGIRVLPSGRATPVSWTIDGDEYDDDEAFNVLLAAPSVASDPMQRLVAAAGAMVSLAAVGLAALALHRLRGMTGDRAVRLALIDLRTAKWLVASAAVLAVLSLLWA